jgi:hypothetical protein
MEGRVQRALFDAQHTLAVFAKDTPDGVSVHGIVPKSLENQNVEGSREEIAAAHVGLRADASVVYTSVT